MLEAYLAAQATRQFDWVRYNCCHFAAGWLLHATGRDPLAGMSTLRRRADVARTVAAWGGTLAAAVSARLGAEALSPRLAQVGDIVLLDMGEGGTPVGICAGRVAVALRDDAGVAFVPMSQATHAWPLGAAC